MKNYYICRHLVYLKWFPWFSITIIKDFATIFAFSLEDFVCGPSKCTDAGIVTDLITWLRLKLDEDIDGYVPAGDGFMGGTCFPEVIANSIDMIKEVKCFCNKHMTNPTKF